MPPSEERRALVINIKAIIRTAINAAAAEDYYDAGFALDTLKDIDPDRDWDYELFEMELEMGYRTMGPRKPSSAENRAVMEMYGREMLRILEGEPVLFKQFKKDGFTVTDKRRTYVLPE